MMLQMRFLWTGALFFVLVGCATGGDNAAWKCSAKGLVNSSYNDSNMAMIHLQGYGGGNNYKVEKNAAGTEAKGVTADGTPFTCTRLP
jgi:hypothetical protein